VREGVVLPLYFQPQFHFNRDGGSISLMVGSKPGVTDKTVECRYHCVVLVVVVV
jgi:hypothetical protein